MQTFIIYHVIIITTHTLCMLFIFANIMSEGGTYIHNCYGGQKENHKSLFGKERRERFMDSSF